MVQAAVSAKFAFDLQAGDVYWCTADCGMVLLPTLHCSCVLLSDNTKTLADIIINNSVSCTSVCWSQELGLSIPS